MPTLTRLNSDMGDILLTNLNTPAKDCTITMPVISGKSAYDLAVENGYVGSLQDWLSSLNGWKPLDSDFANYLEQHLQLSSLFNGVNSKIEANKAELDARIEERINEANALNNQLEQEAQQRVIDTQQLSQDLLNESTNRINSIGQLANNIQSESLIRTSEIEQLHADIEFEQVNRVAEINKLTNITIDQNISIASITTSLSTVSDALETKASATALEDVVSRVSTVEGTTESHSSSLTSLSSAIEGKASNAALQTLSSTVTEIDGKVTTNSHAITDLHGSVTSIEANLTKKADASVLVDYYKQTETNQAIAGQISSFKTNFVMPELGKKFDASGISAYYNKSDTDSAITSKIDSFKANYVDTELGKKFNASAINNYFNKAETNQAITTATTELNASLTKKVNNDDIPAIVELSQTGKRHLVSTVGLDTEKYYPVCFNVNDKKSRITMSVSLGQSKATWATHGAGWSAHIEVTQRASSWGGNDPDITIERFAYYYCAQSPVIRVGQIGQVSKAIFYLRGGSEYFFYVDNNVGSPELYTSKKVFNEQYNVYCEPIAYDKSLEPKSFKTEIQNNASALTTLKAEVKEVNGRVVATASRLDTVSTTVGNHTATIQQHSESIDGIKTNWTLKLNASGRVSGMTLMNDGSTSEFAIEADNFYVGAIDSAYKPFQIKTVGWTGVDGRSYPSGVYINNAIIGDLDAKVIRAGTITGDKIKAGSITGDKIEAGSITADRIQIGSLGRDRLENSFTQSIDATKSKIDNLQVGGRNYYIHYKKNAQTYNIGAFSYSDDVPYGFYVVGKQNDLSGTIRLPNVIDSNGWWTVSFDIRGTQSHPVGVDIDVADNAIGRLYSNANNMWQRVSGSVYIGNYGDGSVYNFVDFSSFEWMYYYIRNIKIEKGNKSTDWTPAPEDVQNGINTVSSVATGARDLLNRWKANGNGTLYIDDNHIAVNKIGANEIAAGAITADKLYVGDVTNYWGNQYFNPNIKPFFGAAAGACGKGLAVALTDTTDYYDGSNKFPVTKGDSFRFELTAYRDSGAGNLTFGFHLYDVNNNWNGQVNTGLTTLQDAGSGWTRYYGVVTIPDSHLYAYAMPRFSSTAAGQWRIGDLVINKRATGTLIVDGSITGDKIKANTEISAPKIKGGEININNNFTVKPDGSLYARQGVFEGTVKANKIEGTIDVASLKSSAWMGGWRQQISFSNNYMLYLISGYNIYNSNWVYDSKSDLVPSFGGLNLNIGYNNYDIGGIKLEMSVWVDQDITVTQKLLLIDDQVTFHLNGNQFKSVNNANGGRVNEVISWNLAKGFNILMIVAANSGWRQCSILLSGDIVDNNTVKFA